MASQAPGTPVRIFRVPKPVYSATGFESIIDWNSEQICPPYVRDYSEEQIRQFEIVPLVLNVPSNSQHVERFIQVSAKVGTKAVSSVARNCLVLARQEYQ